MQEFEEYLTSKKIDPSAFKQGDPQLWESWVQLFSEVHPKSFTQQKLFLINPMRRKYPLSQEAAVAQSKPSSPKPKMKIPIRPIKKS